MDILVAIVLGGFVGWIASIIMKRDQQQGILGNIIVGIVGAFVGGILSRLATGQDYAKITDFSWPGLLWSLLGAIAVSALFNLLTRRAVR